MPNRLRIKKNKTKTSMDLYYSWDGLDTFIFNKHEIGRILLVNTRKSKFEKRLKGFFWVLIYPDGKVVHVWKNYIENDCFYNQSI